jgi:hypothetical protein
MLQPRADLNAPNLTETNEDTVLSIVSSSGSVSRWGKICGGTSCAASIFIDYSTILTRYTFLQWQGILYLNSDLDTVILETFGD